MCKTNWIKYFKYLIFSMNVEYVNFCKYFMNEETLKLNKTKKKKKS